jgi:hypothetical protein
MLPCEYCEGESQGDHPSQSNLWWINRATTLPSQLYGRETDQPPLALRRLYGELTEESSAHLWPARARCFPRALLPKLALFR